MQMSENSKSKRIKIKNELSDKVVIHCCECEYAIYQSRDPFTGKPRWFCGNDIELVDTFGDGELACDNNIGGCEFGKVR